MRFTFTVEVEVQRNEGKFATRDELAEQLREAIEGADPGSLEGENGGQYETTDWSVNDTSDNTPAKKAKAAPKPAAPAPAATEGP
jgi:hypothetical protein